MWLIDDETIYGCFLLFRLRSPISSSNMTAENDSLHATLFIFIHSIVYSISVRAICSIGEKETEIEQNRYQILQLVSSKTISCFLISCFLCVLPSSFRLINHWTVVLFTNKKIPEADCKSVFQRKSQEEIFASKSEINFSLFVVVAREENNFTKHVFESLSLDGLSLTNVDRKLLNFVHNQAL